MEEETILKIPILWRGEKFIIEINSGATLKDLGNELQKLADVKEDTMRLIVPEISGKSSSLLYPFSDEHSRMSLDRIVLKEGKSIRMMGVPEAEVDELLKREKEDLRIAGFAEEERRLKQRRSLGQARVPIKLPQGTYVFCDFRTLEIPGVELNPPPSEALRRMHMLAADPGIIAIMNKHRWRVGIMTEMAPVGYVGVSPKCLLGLNRNRGEEISLRLRTDDLKGFRKYESIKKTLLHELAHMVHSEHDANFYALDKQLNQEAAALDWTRSQSRTLGGFAHSDYLDDNYYINNAGNLPQNIGGSTHNQLASARAASVTAAYQRQANAFISNVVVLAAKAEPDPDDSEVDEFHGKPEISVGQNLGVKDQPNLLGPNLEHNQDIYLDKQRNCEPDPDDSGIMNTKKGDVGNRIISGSGIVEAEIVQYAESIPNEMESGSSETSETDSCLPISFKDRAIVRSNYISNKKNVLNEEGRSWKTLAEPDPDDSEVKNNDSVDGSIRDLVTGSADKHHYWHVGDTCKKSEFVTSPANDTVMAEPDPDDGLIAPVGISEIQIEEQTPANETVMAEPDPDDGLMGPPGISGIQIEEQTQANETVMAEPDPDDGLMVPLGISGIQIEEPDPDDDVLQRMQDPVTVACNRIQKATKMLQSEVNADEATKILHTLIKIIRNVIEHPNEVKFRRLRKGNPVIQTNVAKSKAAMDILSVVGFSEDVVLDEGGKSEMYLVLKRDDPGLLWLAKSSIEACTAC